MAEPTQADRERAKGVRDKGTLINPLTGRIGIERLAQLIADVREEAGIKVEGEAWEASKDG